MIELRNPDRDRADEARRALRRRRAHASSSEAADVGVNLLELDALAHDLIREAGAESCYIDYHPSFGAMPFGKVLCTSVNDAVLHGLPHDYTLRDGDLLSVDFAASRRRLGLRLGAQPGRRYAGPARPRPDRHHPPGARRRHRGRPVRATGSATSRPPSAPSPAPRAHDQHPVRRPRRRPDDARRPAHLQRRPRRPRLPAATRAW